MAQTVEEMLAEYQRQKADAAPSIEDQLGAYQAEKAAQGMKDVTNKESSADLTAANASARDKFVNQDVVKSLMQIPRDLAEGTLALPSFIDKGEQWLIQKGKEQGGVLGEIANNYEALDKRIMPRSLKFGNTEVPLADALPTQEQIQSVDSSVLGKPYESKTGIGQGMRIGIGMLAPWLIPTKAAAVANAARAPLQRMSALQRGSDAAYEAARQNAPDVWPAAYNRMAAEVQRVAPQGAAAANAPSAAHAAQRIEEGVQALNPQPDPMAQRWYNAMGGTPPHVPQPNPVSASEVEELRKGLVAASKTQGADGFYARQMRDVLDTTLRNLGAGTPEYDAAREAYRLYRSSNALESVINVARGRSLNKGSNIGDEVQKLIYQKFQKSYEDTKAGASARMWIRQFPEEVQTMMRGIAESPSKTNTRAFLDAASKNRDAATAIIASSHPAVAAAVKAMQVAATLIKRGMGNRSSNVSRRMIENMQRLTQGLQPVEAGSPGVVPYLKAGALNTGEATQSPDPNVTPAFNPLQFLPQDELPIPNGSVMGIRG